MESRPCLGVKVSIRRSLGDLPGDMTSSAALAMYSRVHSEVEALMTVDMSVIRFDKDRFPLSGKEIADIAGQGLLDIRDVVANQQLMTPDYSQSIFVLVIKKRTAGVSAHQQQILLCLPDQSSIHWTATHSQPIWVRVGRRCWDRCL